MKSQVRCSILTAEEVLAGCSAVGRLYPHIPPMVIWRGWEYAAYRRYSLAEPVLDVGCGDGRFFRFLWPGIQEVMGVDANPGVADAAERSGVYRAVYVTPANDLSGVPTNFGSAFANCSLEHMDDLPQVLRGVARCIRPGGTFLMSVVTDKWLEWSTLPWLVNMAGESARAGSLQSDYERYHHLVSALHPDVWIQQLESAGFEVQEHIPIVPMVTSWIFLLLDQLWHLRQGGEELGNLLHERLRQLHQFPEASSLVLAGVLQMEQDWATGSGAVFCARRKR